MSVVRFDYYKKKVNKKKIVKDIFLIYFITIFLVMIFNSLLIQAYKVPSNSMEPGIKEGSRILVNKFIYGSKYPFTDIRIFDNTKNIKRGDVIVFMSKEYINKNIFIRSLSNFIYTISFSLIDISNHLKHYDSNLYIKRVIGIPGDRIKYFLENGKVVVYINGQKEKNIINVNYNIIEETEKNSPLISTMILQNEYIVKNNEYYVLGDNRVDSSDSRIWGTITSEQIIGRVFLKYWPITDIKFIK